MTRTCFSVYRSLSSPDADRERTRKHKIFAGLVKCADCGWSMRFGTNTANKTPYSYYACSFYGQFGKGYCSMHYIRYDGVVSSGTGKTSILARAVQQDEEMVLKKIQKAGNAQRLQTKKKAETALKRQRGRQKEVDRLFLKMYEDRASGKIQSVISSCYPVNISRSR